MKGIKLCFKNIGGKHSSLLRYLLLAVIFYPLQDRAFCQPWKEHGKLTVKQQNPYYIFHEDGTPFFWFGDTGWEMLHRLNREEITHYLTDRKEKGFNIIQTVIISEFIHPDNEENYYGDKILHNEDPKNPFVTVGNSYSNDTEYDFWDHVDFAVSEAERIGIYIGLLPTWGEWVIPRNGKPLFNTGLDAYTYGYFVGNRYKSFRNIVWILGGDRQPAERPEGADLWRAMAEGITDGVTGKFSFDSKADYSETFMTHHSFASSSEWFHNDKWIDFHTWGSYHADFYIPRSWQVPASDRSLPNPKPTINSEPNYEGHNVNYGIENNSFFTAVDMRMAAYWTMFSGGAGFTYGAHNIWQFTDKTRPPHNKFSVGTWQEALNLPGAAQMIYLKRLMESFPADNLVPDLNIITAGQGDGANHIAAIRGKNHALVYIPTGATVTLKPGITAGKKFEAEWFDPRKGTYSSAGTFENKGELRFSPPGISEELSWLRSGRGCDWVLVIKSTD